MQTHNGPPLDADIMCYLYTMTEHNKKCTSSHCVYLIKESNRLNSFWVNVDICFLKLLTQMQMMRWWRCATLKYYCLFFCCFFVCRNSPSFRSFEEKVESTVSTIKVNSVCVSVYEVIKSDRFYVSELTSKKEACFTSSNCISIS